MIEPVSDLHIDDFCKDATKIWLNLYRAFPVKKTLYVEDICGPDKPDEFGLHSPRFMACFSTLVWLQDSKYLDYGTNLKHEAVEDVVLTHGGFALFASIDLEINGSVAESPARRIDHLHWMLKNATSEELKSLVLRYMMESRRFM